MDGSVRSSEAGQSPRWRFHRYRNVRERVIAAKGQHAEDEMTKVLVTGGAGYIGSHCCIALDQFGFTPVIVDNLRGSGRNPLAGFRFYAGDIRDRAFLRQTFSRERFGAVVHLAGSINVGESVVSPEEVYNNNIYGTMCLLDQIAEGPPIPIVFSSSCAVYGDPAEIPIKESAATRPVSPYGFTKLACERMIEDYSTAHGFSYASLRFFNAAGADPKGQAGEEHEPETHLIPLVLKSMLRLAPRLSVYGDDYNTTDGTAIRDYVHVSDLADAHVRAVNHLVHGGGNLVVNLGTGIGHSVAEVLNVVGDVVGRQVPHKVLPRRPGDPAELVADATLARRRLGWTPSRSDLQTIIADAWRWHSASAQPYPAEGDSLDALQSARKHSGVSSA